MFSITAYITTCSVIHFICSQISTLQVVRCFVMYFIFGMLLSIFGIINVREFIRMVAAVVCIFIQFSPLLYIFEFFDITLYISNRYCCSLECFYWFFIYTSTTNKESNEFVYVINALQTYKMHHIRYILHTESHYI